MTDWTLYILKCGDGSLYTGITNDIDKRIAAHRDGFGAKYTRGRGPFEIIHTEQYPDRSSASKREHAVKALNRPEKLQLASRQVS